MVLLASLQSLDQSITNWTAAMGWPGEAAFRLVLAGIFGGLVGLEREIRGRQAGFRTNLLVCLGSALTMIVSNRIAEHAWHQVGPEYTIRTDPARIAYGVMMGIGFLGGGVIMREGNEKIRGLTTAAAMWCLAAIGLCVGFGLYLLSLWATILVLLSLWLLDYVEDILPKLRYRTLTVRVPWGPNVVAVLVARAQQAKLRVADASFERSADLHFADVFLRVAFTHKDVYHNFERALEADSDYQLIAAREI